MGIIKTEFEGLYVYEPNVFEDDRGYFFESYNKRIWREAGIDLDFVQDNESKSVLGTLRGLHYQLPPFAQTKLVRATIGRVLDVVLDIREGSPTYGRTFTLELSAENKKQLLVPRGFAHAFICLSDTAVFNYKCDNYYSRPHEAIIDPLDPTLNIDWEIEHKNIILSEKDKNAPAWGQHQRFIP